MNNITLTIELCAEDRARLDNILEALKGSAVVPCVAAPEAAPVKAEPETGKAIAPTPAPQEQPKAEAPAQPKAEAPAQPKAAEAVPEVTAAELQSKVVQLVGAGKKDAARAIVQEYAPNVSSVPAEKRAEVLERLNAL